MKKWRWRRRSGAGGDREEVSWKESRGEERREEREERREERGEDCKTAPSIVLVHKKIIV
jgi:hypothetical protein